MKKRRKRKKGLAILLTAAMVVGLMPGVGTLQVSATESDENTVNTVSSNEAMTPEQTVGQATDKLITTWQWIDEEECLDEETGSLSLPGASEQRPAYFDDVTAFLPTQIHATVVNVDDSENLETGEENITLGDWECDDYPEEGAYSGSYTFVAALPEGYALSEEAEALTVLVELGGVKMYDADTVTETGYENGFCTTYTEGTECSKHGTDCKGYQPAEPVSDTHHSELNTQFNGYYAIENAGQLYWFAGLVNGTLGYVSQNTSANAVLTTDIIVNKSVLDTNGAPNSGTFTEWKPICKDTDDISGYYNGTFDGNKHTISGLYYDNSDTEGVGLFGWSRGTIKNVGVVDSCFNGYSYVGGVCGYNYRGTITNCYNSGTVSGNDCVGGVCGHNYAWSTTAGGTRKSIISNCYNTGTVKGELLIGGVCGYNESNSNSTATITNCYYDSNAYIGDAIGTDEDTSTNVEGKSTDKFKSGQVAYLLNGSKSSNSLVWYQNLGEGGDASPVLDTSHGTVYQCTPCTYYYSNTADKQIEHTYILDTTDNKKHICEKCQASEEHALADLKYEANDETDTITVTCGKCNENLGTVTLSAPTVDLTYDGNEKTVSVEFTIARRPVNIKANDASKTYGETDPALSYTVSEETPLVYGEALSGALSRLEGENAVTYKITQGTVTNDNNPNYDITFNKGTFTINKAKKQDMGDFTIEYYESGGKFTVSIDPIQDAEYKFDIGNSTGNWTDNSSISGIEHNTQGIVYVRYKGDNNHEPGKEAYKQITTGHGECILVWFPGQEASCTENGHYDHWYCNGCKRYYWDEVGTSEAQESEITIVAPGHIDKYDDGVCDICNAIVNDYKHLQSCIKNYKNIQQNDYSDASYQTLQKALEEAQKLTDKNSKEELTAAYEALIAADKGLKQTALIVGTVANPSDTGKQTGGGRYAVGETVTLTAEGVEGWIFNGWYDSDKLISDKAKVTFVVTEDMSGTVSYTAKYTHVSHTMDENTHKCSICGISYYKVTFTGAVTSETYTTGNVEFPAGDYIFKVGDAVIDTADYTVSADTTITIESLTEAAKYAVTIIGDAHCALTITDSNGNTIKSGDEVAAGTILKVSVKVDDGYTLTTTPESSYTVSDVTTITAVTEAKTYAVTVDNTYYKSGEAEAPTVKVADLSAVPYGTSLKLTAADANTGYEFLGWYQTNGKQLTAEKVYTVTITSALTVQPRYQKNSGTVTFVANGSVVGTISNATNSTVIEFPSNVDAYVGFKFAGWDKTEEQIHSALASAKAVGTAGPLSYTWTKSNVNAGDIWYVRPYIIYTDEANEEHTVYGDRVTLCAGTAYDPAEKATAKIDGISYDSTSQKAKFVAYLAVPENAVIQKAGLVAKSQAAGFNPDTEILSANNAQYVKSSTLAVGTNGPVTYTWTKSSVNTGDIWYVRAYLVYTDEDGIEHTVYGNLLKYTAQ